MERPDTRRIWEANASAWIELSRAGFDVYRDLVNTPAFFATLPAVGGLFGLDVGCGEGHNTRLLAGEGANVVALDVSLGFVTAAAAVPGDGIRFVVADGAVLPLRDARFDFVTGFMSLMDVSDPETTLREVARVLKPGGFAQFSIVHPATSTSMRRWINDDEGRREAVAIGDYFFEGVLTEVWTFGAQPEEMRLRLRPFTITYHAADAHQLVQRVRRCRPGGRSDRRAARRRGNRAGPSRGRRHADRSVLLALPGTKASVVVAGRPVRVSVRQPARDRRSTGHGIWLIR